MWQWTTDVAVTMQPPVRYVTKDGGSRHTYASGNVREPSQGKSRFDLLIPAGVPYREQILTRFADLMARGAEKYSDRNWENANSEEEEARFQEAAFRHFMQWFTGEDDEDHAAALMFNVMAYETTRYKRRLND